MTRQSAMNCGTTPTRLCLASVWAASRHHHVPQTKQKHRCDRREGDRNAIRTSVVGQFGSMSARSSVSPCHIKIEADDDERDNNARKSERENIAHVVSATPALIHFRI